MRSFEIIKKQKKCIAIVIITVLLFLFNTLPVFAKDVADRLPHLIQTMSEQDEYEGLLHLGFLTTRIAENEDVDKAYQNVKASVVKMGFGNLRGSGSIFKLQEDRMLLVTCRHLFENTERTDGVKITFADQTQAVGSVHYLSEEYDIAFVEVPIQDVPIRTLKRIRQIVPNPSTQEVGTVAGTEMFHAGMLDAEGAISERGVVDNPWKYFPEFNSFMMDSFCSGRPGMSGGGTFDAYGYYIGMIAGGLSEKTASIPIGVILEEYNKISH